MQKIGFFALLGGVPTMKKAGLMPASHEKVEPRDSNVSQII